MKITSPQQNNEEIVLSILNDALVFERLTENLYKVLKMDDGTWCPAEGNYKGVVSAYKILNIDDTSHLRDDLQNVFSRYAESNIDLAPASKGIYLEWQQIIKAQAI